jgi:hypothetical protein
MTGVEVTAIKQVTPQAHKHGMRDGYISQAAQRAPAEAQGDRQADATNLLDQFMWQSSPR